MRDTGKARRPRFVAPRFGELLTEPAPDISWRGRFRSRLRTEHPGRPLQGLSLPAVIWFGWTSNCCASSASVFSPLGSRSPLRFDSRRVLPAPQPSWPPSGRNSTYPTRSKIPSQFILRLRPWRSRELAPQSQVPRSLSQAPCLTLGLKHLFTVCTSLRTEQRGSAAQHAHTNDRGVPT